MPTLFVLEAGGAAEVPRHPEYEPGDPNGWYRVPVPTSLTIGNGGLVDWPIVTPDNPLIRSERNPVFHTPEMPYVDWVPVNYSPIGFGGANTTEARQAGDTGVDMTDMGNFTPAPMQTAFTVWPSNTDNQAGSVLFCTTGPLTPTASVASATDLRWADAQPIDYSSPLGHYTAKFSRADTATDSAFTGGIEGGSGNQGASRMPGYATIRVHEIVRGYIGHALKICVDSYANLHTAATIGDAYCHPADTADSYWPDFGSTAGGGIPVEAKVGCRSVPTSARPTGTTLGDQAAQMIYDAWHDYGAYIADTTKGQNAMYISIEIGPDGDGEEIFETKYGFPFKSRYSDTTAATDRRRFVDHMLVMYANLAIVTNPSLAADAADVPRVVPLSPPVGTITQWRDGVIPFPDGVP